MATSLYSHDRMCWGGPQPVQTPVAQISGANALTTVQQGVYTFSPYPYGVIYDVILHFTAMNVNGGTIVIDLFNIGTAGGTQGANSFFTTPWTFNANQNSPVTYSARGAAGYSRGGAVLKTPEIGIIKEADLVQYMSSYGLNLGQPFSGRISSPVGSSITNLCLTIVMAASDLPAFFS